MIQMVRTKQTLKREPPRRAGKTKIAMVRPQRLSLEEAGEDGTRWWLMRGAFKTKYDKMLAEQIQVFSDNRESEEYSINDVDEAIISLGLLPIVEEIIARPFFLTDQLPLRDVVSEYNRMITARAVGQSSPPRLIDVQYFDALADEIVAVENLAPYLADLLIEYSSLTEEIQGAERAATFAELLLDRMDL